MEKTKRYMAVDQHGDIEHGLIHPRKELAERNSVQHAEKMYVDGKDGESYHIGYIVAGHWYTIYEVIPMRKTV